MGYSQSHILEVRRKILSTAAQLFRRQGYHPTSIQQVMEQAGLTHGGFYAHYKSKEDLFTKVMDQDLNFQVSIESLKIQITDPSVLFQTAISYYLNFKNRDRVGNACSMVTLGSEVARMKKPARKAYTKQLKKLVDNLETLTGQRGKSLSTLATCVGALALARAVVDEELAQEILKSCTEQVFSKD